LRTHHRRFAKHFLSHCVRQRYKVARSLVLPAMANFIQPGPGLHSPS
jgi:hypothetical protein